MYPNRIAGNKILGQLKTIRIMVTHAGPTPRKINSDGVRNVYHRCIIAAGDSHGDLLIDTTAVIVGEGDGIGLNQLFTSTHGCNGAFIDLKVPVDDLVGCIEGGRKCADIVARIRYEREGVIVPSIDICEGKGAAVYQNIRIIGQVIVIGYFVELGYFACIRVVVQNH